MPAKEIIELEELQKHFHEPMADVAKQFGVCTTFFKKVCRLHGIKRWPYRKMKSLQKKITHLKTANGADGCAGSKANNLQQKLAELRHMRPMECDSQALVQEAQAKSDDSETEGSQAVEPIAQGPSDHAGMEIEDVENSEYQQVEELVCHVLLSLRNGTPPTQPTKWCPKELPPLKQLIFSMGVRQAVKPSSRSHSPAGSMSSGDTVPNDSVSSSPVGTRERRPSVGSIDSLLC